MSMSFLTSFTISLNKFAKDKDLKIQRSYLVYLSECFLSALSGIVMGLLLAVIQDNNLICIIGASVGSSLGKNGLNVIAKYILQQVIKINENVYSIENEDTSNDKNNNN